MQTEIQIPKRFYAIDLVRGIAAFSVIFWHWQHFYIDANFVNHRILKNQPFYDLFFKFYRDGYMAVEFFFMVSGFVFFWLYMTEIGQKKVGFVKFFFLRFSRLYPLHFVTLIFVAIMQMISKFSLGHFIIYPGNDLYHFVLNIFFISAWGIQKQNSFNAPVWSVSVELLLYIVFFSFAYLSGVIKFSKAVLIFVFLIVVYNLENLISIQIFRGLFAFFIGGLVFFIYKASINYKISSQIIAIVIVLVLYTLGILYKQDLIKLTQVNSVMYNLIVFFLYKYYVLFPYMVVILVLCLWETYIGPLGDRLAILGEISFAVYMVHFPLQLTMMFVFKLNQWDLKFFYTPQSMLLFFGILIPLAYAVHKYFEKPVQKYLRDHYIKK